MVTDLPGLLPAEGDVLEELENLTKAARLSGGRVQRLVRIDAWLEAQDNEPEVVRVDVTRGHGSFAAMAARGMGNAAVAQLQPTAALERTFIRPKEEPPEGSDAAPAGGPEVALGICRRHQQEEGRWRSLQATRLELDPHPDLGAAGFGANSSVQLSRWARPTQELPATPHGQEFDSVVVTFIGVDGAQIGHHNKQVNLRRYHLEPDIDLAAALQDERVQQAFTSYALNPDDPASRREAVAALRAVRTGPATDWTVAEHQAVVTSGTSGPAGQLPGTIVLTDCRGIQVGNHLRQYNTFNYVCAPTVAAYDLFRQNPKLVESVVDYACVPGSNGIRSVQRRLSAAVCGDAETALAREPGSGRLPVRSMTVEGGQGLTMGHRNKQVDKLDVAVDVSQVLDGIAEQHRIQKLRLAELEAQKLKLAPLEKRAELPRLEAERLSRAAEQAVTATHRQLARAFRLGR